MSDAYRPRLEEAAEALEATRLRLRALVPALEGWRWRQRLRALSDVARSVVRDDAQSRGLLERALRRAEAERWPAGPTRALLDETRALLDRLEVALHALGVDTLAAALAQVVGVPRAVPAAERDAAAAEVLEAGDEVVLTLTRFGALLERVFSRPLARELPLPFTLAELDEVLAAQPDGTRALDEAWARVAAVDTTGGVERELRRRALQLPKRGRGPAGPRALVHAQFWWSRADAVREQLVEERFAPVRVAAGERAPCVRFLLQREREGGARLELADVARAALLSLAHELGGVPAARPPLAGGAARLRRWAREADALEGDDDWRRLREALRHRARAPAGPVVPPLYRVASPRPPARLPERLADFFADGATK
ncbi:MAG: hypothetical protein ACOZQL_21105 [Myxococcota bacterium]